MASSFSNPIKVATSIFRSAWINSQPFLLYFKPTAFCDLRCKICDRWKTDYPKSEEMQLPEIEQMLKKFSDAGATILTLWGGEPTLRKDCGDILAAAKNLGYRTAMCTNGRLLARRAEQIMPHLDTLLCSLDGVGKVHDESRGVEGLFDRVIEGIEAAKTYPKKRIKIWATVHNNNLDTIKPLADLARELKVGIEFFPVSPVEGYNNDVVCNDEALLDAFTQIRDLKSDGYPIWNPDRVLDIMAENRPFKCNFGRIALQVDHRGNVHCCEEPTGEPLHRLGNYRELDLKELYRSDHYQSCVADLAKCNKCRLPCVVELSDELPIALGGMFVRALYR